MSVPQINPDPCIDTVLPLIHRQQMFGNKFVVADPLDIVSTPV